MTRLKDVMKIFPSRLSRESQHVSFSCEKFHRRTCARFEIRSSFSVNLNNWIERDTWPRWTPRFNVVVYEQLRLLEAIKKCWLESSREAALERGSLLSICSGSLKMHSLKLNKMLTPTADPQVFLSHDSLLLLLPQQLKTENSFAFPLSLWSRAYRRRDDLTLILLSFCSCTQ